MINKYALALALALGWNGSTSAMTLGLGVEIEPLPAFSANVRGTWFADASTGQTKLTLFFGGAPVLLTESGSLDTDRAMSGVLELEFDYVDPSGRFIGGETNVQLDYDVPAGPIMLPFVSELSSLTIEALEIDTDSFTSFALVNFLLDGNAAGSFGLLEDLFTGEIFASVSFDVRGFDGDAADLFIPAGNAFGGVRRLGFFSMYNVAEPPPSPAPLPATVPLVLAGTAAPAFVRRRA